MNARNTSERSILRNRYNMKLRDRHRRAGVTPGVPEEFKQLVREELVNAYMDAIELLHELAESQRPMCGT